MYLASHTHSPPGSVSGGDRDRDGVLPFSCKTISSSSCLRAKSKKYDFGEPAEFSSSAKYVQTERVVLVEGEDATRSL